MKIKAEGLNEIDKFTARKVKKEEEMKIKCPNCAVYGVHDICSTCNGTGFVDVKND